jgi:signal transduction histidine kinase
MKLAHKMKIFFYPAILVPIFLIIVLGILVFHGYFSTVIGLNWTKKDFLELLNPLYMGNEMIQETYEELLGVAEENPEQLLDESYLAQIDESLDSKNSFLVVKTENETVYSGSASVEELEDILPYYYDGNQNMDVGIYVKEPQDYLIRQVNFKIDEEQKGSAYILCDLDAYAVYYRNALLWIVFAAFVILILTSLMCSRYIRKELLNPLQELENGIEEIKKGNLKAEVPVDTVDEIGEVAVSFNEMRDQLKRLIDDRLHYEEENRVLISNISHDLKTPITAIKGYVEGIMDGVATTPEMMDKYIKTIYVKADALDAMINELSIYSKIDNDTIPYDFKRLNLDSFFRDCIDDLSIDLESKNMEITYFNYCPKELNVIADTEQLKRVITNIIMNSVKYNDKDKGRINIRIRENGAYVRVEIEDNGMGIDEKDLPYIFDRLFRADASRNSRLGGTGLGLSIARKIIEEHGGEIWAKSRKNTGTIIIFTLEREKEGRYERKSDDFNYRRRA